MNIHYSTRYKKDVKLCKKRHYDMEKMKELIKLILSGEELPQKYNNHPLSGEWKGCFDAHIEGDWVLIYKMSDDTLTLWRTGTTFVS
jgi:mRNA interferase YafQ